jgi:hypothetical protein
VGSRRSGNQARQVAEIEGSAGCCAPRRRGDTATASDHTATTTASNHATATATTASDHATTASDHATTASDAGGHGDGDGHGDSHGVGHRSAEGLGFRDCAWSLRFGFRETSVGPARARGAAQDAQRSTPQSGLEVEGSLG